MIMKKIAILLGATGLTGGILLDLLLKDPLTEKVKVFGRSATGVSHAKLEEHLGDMFQIDNFSEVFKGDVVFCCIGTTKANTPNKETYKKIDYGIPVSSARLAKKNGIPVFEVISAMGATTNSSTFYNKVKGEMERDVKSSGVENTYFFQPSLIGGDRSENRFGERIAQIAMGTFGFLVPKKYKIIEPITIARAMLHVAYNGYAKALIENDEIKAIVEN